MMKMQNHRQRPIGAAQSCALGILAASGGFMRVFAQFSWTFPHTIRADARVRRKTPVLVLGTQMLC